MTRVLLFAFLLTLLTIIAAQAQVEMGGNGFGGAGVEGGGAQAVPEIPPALLLMGASAVGYAARRIALRRGR